MSAPTIRALIADDARAVRVALTANLTKAGFEVESVPTAEEGLELLGQEHFDVVLTDVRMPGRGGMWLAEQALQLYPDLILIVMTGHGRVEDAVEAMRFGATDYVIKPVSKDEILMILSRALEGRALRAEVQNLRDVVQAHFGFENIVGTTPVMQAVYEQVQAVAPTRTLVLLNGETGTGKELIAHAIHAQSPREDAGFVRVNCAALPDTLLESELFGHEKGAFTGAVKRHIGRFEQANHGSIFLDEIGDISPAMQVKLLRILEAGEFQRLGGRETIKVDVRVIAATNRDLRQEVAEGRFRRDLYYRLNVFSIRLPALRDRRDDIPALVGHFVSRYAERNDRNGLSIAASAMQDLLRHDWPGNVRELEHVIERSVILTQGDVIQRVHLGDGAPIQTNAPLAANAQYTGTLKDQVDAFERQRIVDALRDAQGNQAEAARVLGISRSVINYKIKRHNIQQRAVEFD